MPWLPLDPVLLRLGLYIKIDHGWMEHPFVRNVFTVSSPTEIAIIRKHRLTKLLYDPELSHADVVEAITNPTGPVQEFEIDAETAQDAEADEASILKEKHRQIQSALDHRKAIDENCRTYTNAANEVSVMMAMANAGQADMLHSAEKILSAMTGVVEQGKVALSLVCAESRPEPGQELAMQGINVSALATLTAKTLGLSAEEIAHVGMGGLFHNIGMSRVPLAVRVKSEEDLSPTETKLLRMYPQLGKEILEAISGVPEAVVEIVYQHREYLDGTGFPKRLINGDIAKTARLVGTIVEYNLIASDQRSARYMGPAQALSYVYTKLKNKFGPDVVEPFIATVTVFPPGSFVELSDGSFGLVLKSNTQERLRPVVMLYERQASHDQPAIIDLARERSISIEKALDPKGLPDRVKDALLTTKLQGYVITGK
ncbi:HD-GYP domain-containing protein [Nitrospira sp. BLG_1]|uniref:HD-GYP domain-containing protein n=1 Tax=Nitrospira sp. BLG_1 TaxID=3395883 RepID=UPI0039BC5A42